MGFKDLLLTVWGFTQAGIFGIENYLNSKYLFKNKCLGIPSVQFA